MFWSPHLVEYFEVCSLLVAGEPVLGNRRAEGLPAGGEGGGAWEGPGGGARVGATEGGWRGGGGGGGGEVGVQVVGVGRVEVGEE